MLRTTAEPRRPAYDMRQQERVDPQPTYVLDRQPLLPLYHDSRSHAIPRPTAGIGYMSDNYEPALPRKVPVQNTHASRSLPAPSRRPSEQDIALPSIEREPNDVPTPLRIKDTSYLSQQDRHHAPLSYANVQSPQRGQDRVFEPAAKRMRIHADDESFEPAKPLQAHIPRLQENRPMDLYTRRRAQPAPEMIDLTSSPTARSNNGSYALDPYNRVEARGAYQGAPMRAVARAHMPEYDRVQHSNPGFRENLVRIRAQGNQVPRSPKYGHHRIP